MKPITIYKAIKSLSSPFTPSPVSLCLPSDPPHIPLTLWHLFISLSVPIPLSIPYHLSSTKCSVPPPPCQCAPYLNISISLFLPPHFYQPNPPHPHPQGHPSSSSSVTNSLTTYPWLTWGSLSSPVWHWTHRNPLVTASWACFGKECRIKLWLTWANILATFDLNVNSINMIYHECEQLFYLKCMCSSIYMYICTTKLLGNETCMSNVHEYRRSDVALLNK